MTNEIDWTKAPEGATHYAIVDDEVVYYKSNGECMLGNHGKSWITDTSHASWIMDNTHKIPELSTLSGTSAKPLQPVFTKAMQDNKELPPIGSKFIHQGKIVKTLSTSKEEGGVVTFLDEGSIACCWNNDSWVVAIEIKTDKEKADDLFKFYLKGENVSTHKSFSQAVIDGDFGDNIKWSK